MRPDTAATGDLQPDSIVVTERDRLLGRLLDHCECIPDPKEVFELLDLLREMGAITPDEAAGTMHLYWEGV